MFIGGLKFDERVVPWVLSTGTPGPTLSWDRRIEHLPPDSSLTLDRLAWTTRLSRSPVRFVIQERSREQHRAPSAAAIDETFASMWSYRPRSLIVSLSGGYDRRFILCLLHRLRSTSTRLETITWGLETERTTPGTDGQVTAEVAVALGVPSHFISLDHTSVEPEQDLARFIVNSEGRIDHVAEYVDGMNLWCCIHESQVETILPGDEGFGWVPVATERAGRYSFGLGLASDYTNLELLLCHFDIPSDELPGDYLREAHEAAETWRDRLYSMYRIPTILAGLNDVKLSYVELLNPLPSRRVLEQVRSLPDELCTNKVLFKEIADAISPPIPYAIARAIGSQGEILARADYIVFVSQWLRDLEGARSPLPGGMLRRIAAGMGQLSAGKSWIASVRRYAFVSLIPKHLRNQLRDFKPQSRNRNLSRFRAFILSSGLLLIDDDSDAMRRTR